MKRCITCLYPTTKPDLYFNEAGECSACLNSKKKKEFDWDQKEKELDELLDRFHGECIVPSSAGKDSHAQVIYLVNKRVNVTAVTARTCMLSGIGRKNVDNLAKYARTIEYMPNMAVRAKLNRLGLNLVGDISLPEHMAIFSIPFQASKDLNIPLIMYGENSQLEYGGQKDTEYAKQLTVRWRSELGGFCGIRPVDFIGMDGITKRDMRDYELPEDIGNTEAHFLGAYTFWDSRNNAKIAKEHGMIQVKPCEANWWEFENIDNISTGIHDYFMYLKYGFGRGCTQISVDIRNGLISREDALEWLKSHDGLYPNEYMGVSLKDILLHLGMSQEEFDNICEQFTTNKCSQPA